MKKSLLLTGAAVLCASVASAEIPEPMQISDASISNISPDGKYAVSSIYGSMVIFNLLDGTEFAYDEDGDHYYTPGLGNVFSATGVMVGSQYYEDASYWRNGEWNLLPVPEEYAFSNSANSITPDGKRICGGIGLAAISIEGDNLMMVPAIWNANADGTYGDPVILPYPERDFSGRVPQYVTAVGISDDGKTVVGQMTDCSGFIQQPIVYTEGADGKWSYTLLHSEMFNPDNLEFPEHPGDGPAGPSLMDYMSDEERASWQEAYDAWLESGYTLEYPNEEDYITAEGMAKYEEAYAKYQETYAAWEEKYIAWEDVFYACVEVAPEFVFNNVRLSGDGRYYVTTVATSLDDPMSWFPVTSYNPAYFDLTTGEYTVMADAENLMINVIAADGTMIASNPQGVENGQAYVIKDGKCETLFDWMAAHYPTVSEWMDEYMRWDVEAYEYNADTEEYELVVNPAVLLTGIATATPDLKVMATWVPNVWDFSTEAESFIFDLRDPASIKSVAVSTEESETVKGIYDMMGRKLNDANAPGLYIINGKKVVK